MSVCTLASIHEPLSQGRERRRVQMKTRRLVARGKRRGIRARRVRVAKERLHARRFFVRQIHEGPHWGSRQSTQYQSSPGTDRRPSHLTWHVFLHVPARGGRYSDRWLYATRSSRRRVDGVEVDAITQHETPATDRPMRRFTGAFRSQSCVSTGQIEVSPRSSPGTAPRL